jgi:hypothetical protein
MAVRHKRQRWLRTGCHDVGDPKACDTFGPSLIAIALMIGGRDRFVSLLIEIKRL